ncbi:MAG: AbrB/MazE/SpoVT family DNA-binding domain-containing protein [Clostridia bacterium]|nr:AbrB/MazE/SpoVT family DNA-binding domain-containing protein [Clostridia bacterium]MBQ9429162.1 AbrB/MazE/SpoVT family DNA-binding domain-containing protein [Clostridia bacterium]
MKSTGIIRKIDVLGRIVLPIELRRHLNIDTGDDIEIRAEGKSVILTKFAPDCLFCGGKRDLADFDGKKICGACRAKIAKL